MEAYESLIQTLGLSMGAAWASGINLYATLLVLGLGGIYGVVALPPELEILTNPATIGAAGLMYMVEFFADKTPGVDTAWDGIHSFIRIPAGALLAAGAVGEVSPALAVAAAIAGGGMSAATHSAKSGTRILINSSPEPFSNWGASIGEDLLVFAGLWAALNHPLFFLIALVLFIFLLIWLLPKIWKGIKKLFSVIGRILSVEKSSKQASETEDELSQLDTLNRLRQSGGLSEEEYNEAKAKILKSHKNY
jgi:hypothetical protein